MLLKATPPPPPTTTHFGTFAIKMPNHDSNCSILTLQNELIQSAPDLQQQKQNTIDNIKNRFTVKNLLHVNNY